jgi:hypothetical protein
MMVDKWIKLTNKYDTRCVQCGEWIAKGETVLWLKKLGVKHEECNLGNEKDDTALIIYDDEQDQDDIPSNEALTE